MIADILGSRDTTIELENIEFTSSYELNKAEDKRSKG